MASTWGTHERRPSSGGGARAIIGRGIRSEIHTHRFGERPDERDVRHRGPTSAGNPIEAARFGARHGCPRDRDHPGVGHRCARRPARDRCQPRPHGGLTGFGHLRERCRIAAQRWGIRHMARRSPRHLPTAVESRHRRGRVRRNRGRNRCTHPHDGGNRGGAPPHSDGAPSDHRGSCRPDDRRRGRWIHTRARAVGLPGIERGSVHRRDPGCDRLGVVRRHRRFAP